MNTKNPLNRMEKFLKLETDPWFSRVWKKLKKSELQIAIDFINENNDLDIGDFEYKLNRFFLDRDKPRRYLEILELIMISNTFRRDENG